MRIQTFLRYLRIRSFPLDTEEGRASERYRRAVWAMLSSFFARGITLIAMILTVSLTVPYLGAERFGAWMTVASLTAMLSFLDMGIGNALTNRVAASAGAKDNAELTQAISGGLGILGIVSVVLGLLLTITASKLPWSKLINIQSPELIQEIVDTAVLFAILFATSTFTNGITRVYFGLQRGFEVHVIGAIGSLGGLISLYIAASNESGLPVLLACSMIGTQIGHLLLLIRLFKDGQLSIKGIKKNISKETPNLLQSGGLFFLLQIGTMVAGGADSLIIANAAGAASVAAFAVILRLTQLVSQPLAMLNAPLWGAYADAYTQNEKAFVRTTFRRSFIITLSASCIGALILALFGEELVSLWTKDRVSAPMFLLIAMAVWLVLESTGNALGILLNGLGIVRQQVWVVSAFIVIALPLKIVLAQTMGATGVVIAGILAYLLTTVAGYGLVFKKDVLEKLK